MRFTETKLKGAYIIEIDKIEDDRGFFGRSWCERELKEYNLKTNLVQSNISFNRKKGTLRGMHFQKNPYQETKLVRCTKGAVYDVIIDLRTNSKTYKQWFGVELNEKNHKMLYIPEDFAHGFITLKDNSELFYLVTQYYNKNYEAGVLWNDASIGIEWPIEVSEISDKDCNHPLLK